MFEIKRSRITLFELAYGRANALDLDILAAIRAALDDLAQDPSIRAVVLTGRGSMFSAGVDLPQLLQKGPDYLFSMWAAIDRSLLRLIQFPKPIAAAVNGHAIAGGCLLAQACDYRIMARGRALIGVPELRVGVPFPRMALEVMRHSLSPSAFQRVVYLGRNFSVDEALETGLLDEAVPRKDLLDRAYEIAESLAAIPADSFAANKRDVRLPTVEAFRSHDDSLIQKALKAEGLFEAVGKFVEENIGGRASRKDPKAQSTPSES